MTEPRILVITPVKHIAGVPEILESAGIVTYIDDPMPQEVMSVIGGYHALYTNPNKSKVYIGPEILDAAPELRVICTASTGTNHIDKKYAQARGVEILALTEERAVIERISSTAELAFALMMASLRHVVPGFRSVLDGEWDYTQFIGRQVNHLTVGVIGYGRLGRMFAGYARAFGARVLVHDPYKTVDGEGLEQVTDLAELLRQSDVISIHVHVTDETLGMLNRARFAEMNGDVLIVNTSRGDVINESELVEFLKLNPRARVATDVLEDEIRNRLASPLLRFAHESDQVLITPHIGGMTSDAQEIAYGHAASRLRDFLKAGEPVAEESRA